MLEELLPATIFAVFLIFVRIGGALMVMPGFGETYVSPRSRLMFALLMALVLTPVLTPLLPALPDSAAVLFVLVMGELFVGIFFGVLASVMMAALTTAGMIMAYMSTLANALVNDPATQQQGSIAGSFLTATAVVLIFVLDLHHMMLSALVDSYAVFPPGELPPMGDFSRFLTETVARSFQLSLQLAAPFVVVGLIFYLGVGLLARLMPQVQIFFVVMPLQIGMGMVVMFISLPAIMFWFLSNFEETFAPLFGG